MRSNKRQRARARLATSTPVNIMFSNGLGVCKYGNAGSRSICLNKTREIVDITAPTFTSVSPSAGATVNTTAVGYTLSEAIASGSVKWTQTGGTVDGNSPHTANLFGAELAAGARASAVLTNAPTLVDGAIYKIEFNGTDAAGNTTQVSVTGITFDDITAPTFDSAAVGYKLLTVTQFPTAPAYGATVTQATSGAQGKVHSYLAAGAVSTLIVKQTSISPANFNGTNNVTVGTETVSTGAITSMDSEIFITLSEPIVTGSTVTLNDFTIVGTTATTLSSVELDAGTVKLSLTSWVVAGETPTVAFTATTTVLEDAAGNQLTDFTAQNVTNKT